VTSALVSALPLGFLSKIRKVGSNDVTYLSGILHPVKVKVKLKVNLPLCLTKHHPMKTCWGVEIYLHVFLISELDGDEWSDSFSGPFNTEENLIYTLRQICVLDSCFYLLLFKFLTERLFPRNIPFHALTNSSFMTIFSCI